MQRRMGQMGFADDLVPVSSGFLSEVNGFVDWLGIETELKGIYGSSTGRPSYPLLVLFKALLLQQWYGLSDPGLEEALGDRISFRQFAGLSLSDPVPDHSTLSRFRNQLGDRFEGLLSSLNAQFETRGLIVKRGTLLDASFVRASSGKKSVDAESGCYGRYPEKGTTGYKMHAAVDQDSGLVRRVIVTPANVNDTMPADDLILGDEQAVYADKAYDKKSRRAELEARGVFAGLMHRPSQYHALNPEQVRFNKAVSRQRFPVERTFAVLKEHYRLRRTRYLGLTRTAVQVTLAVMAMNIKRGLKLAIT
jgi:IS5 family transposase